MCRIVEVNKKNDIATWYYSRSNRAFIEPFDFENSQAIMIRKQGIYVIHISARWGPIKGDTYFTTVNGRDVCQNRPNLEEYVMTIWITLIS